MHALQINGKHHIANMSDPRIPAALAGVVEGVESLNDFRPHTNFKQRPNYTFSGTTGGTEHAVVPADLATIYNLNPLFQTGISGQGQTVVVIEDTNIHAAADWRTFRAAFGLDLYTAGSLIQVHPASSKPSNCSNPGIVPDSEEEAQLDTEWSSAAAPSAEIEVASCSDSQTTFGGLIALQNLINSANPPAIVSISYGECESSNGAAANAAFNSTYQQAVAEGTSVFVSAGDEGAASCDADLPTSYEGIAVSGFASTPYNVAVGGTDFSDTYSGTTANYWNAGNTPVYGSAKSYIPEIPWNDSCASVLISSSQGYAKPYGLAGFCNSVAGLTYLSTASGSGGPSGCATGSGPETGGVGGTCKGYSKPSWQVLLGVPSDGVRDLPDVSLFAANGIWNHYYLLCDSDPADDSNLCEGPPSGWAGAGGTSFSSPILAAIQSLVNQTTGSRQGNPNPTYYAMAASEYGATGTAKCNSSKGSAASLACVFYDVTLGDMDVNCLGTDDCYHDRGINGVLSTSDALYRRAYATNTGWDFATGIGTINATNLVEAWSSAQSRLGLR
jgi:subtilase family serine protease